MKTLSIVFLFLGLSLSSFGQVLDETQYPQSTTLNNNEVVYFINYGEVYREDVRIDRIDHLSPPSRAKSILNYQGQIVVLGDDGYVYILEENSSETEWIEIAHDANVRTLLISNEKDLVALTESNELWVYGGGPVLPIRRVGLLPAGKIPIPYTYEVRESSFLDTGIQGVEDIRPLGEDIQVLYDDDRDTQNYSDVGPDVDGGREFEFTIERKILSDLICLYSNNNEYSVRELHLEKDAGDLYVTLQYKVSTFPLLRSWSPSYKMPLRDANHYIQGGLQSTQIMDIFERFIMPNAPTPNRWGIISCDLK